MRAFLWTLAVCVAAVRPHGALLQQQYELELDSTSTRLSPVQKVVNMLRDMQKNLQKELEEDESTYHKMSCWCNDNSYEKQEAIEAAEAKMKQLNADIEEGTAKSEQLKAEIQKLKDEIAANKEALASAQAVRDKELAEFRKSDTDCSENAQSLKAAITVLSKHHAEPAQSETAAKKEAFRTNNQGGSSAVGSNDSAFLQARAKIDFDSLSKIVSTHSDADTATKVISAIQAPSYGAQSGEILGILKQMLEDMDGDCSAAAEKEAAAAKNFAEMKEAKREEIAAGEKMQTEKEDQLADTLKKLAEDKEDLDDTSAQHQTDIDFLNNLKDTCATIDEDWQKREKIRNEEIKAVSETIEILTSDAAMDTFHGTFGHGQKELTEAEQAEADKNVAATDTQAVSFIQTQMADRRARALAKVNQFKEDPQMAMLATTVQLDAFTRVKKAINDMVDQLKVQQSDEVKKNDACKANIQQNEVDAQNSRNLHDDQKAQIAAYEADIERLAGEIDQAKKDIDSANVEMQRATNLKIQESKDFQMSFMDQQATEKILRLALARMNKFYGDQAAMLQQPPSFIQKQTPPVMAKTYSASSASSPVIGMLEDLINEAKEMQAQAAADERDSTAGYERQVGEHNNSIKALQESVVSKNKEKADAEQALGQTKQDLAGTVQELEDLGKLNGELHSDCDFTLKNFDSRQDKRRGEIEALQDALAILSGSQ